jgi:NADH-quinone oxidoreductase subunit N
MSGFYTAADHFALLPAILLALFGCASLFFAGRGGLLILLTGEFFAGFMLWRQWRFVRAAEAPLAAFQGALAIDEMALYFNALFVAGAALSALISYRYLEIAGEHENEYYGLMLLAQAGMFFLAAGTELVTLFIGLETMAVSFYVLVGFLRADRRSNEAAMKYLLLGAFSTGFLLYGFSLLYGLTGTTRLGGMAARLASVDPADPLLALAVVTAGAGLAFKIGAAPFHMWTPDAYEGAPTPVTAYLSVASKAAAFALAIRILQGPLAAARDIWQPMAVAVAIASLTVGNLAAISQSNVKRMLAYSSVGHSGYILLGLAAGNDLGYRGVLVYLAIFTFMNLGAFLVLAALRREGIAGEHLDELNGLARRAPLYAVMMAVFLLSLAGIPPTAGFIAKYYIFAALVGAEQYALAVIGALYVVVSLYYYFRIVRAMFLADLTQDQPLAESWGVRVSLAAAAIGTIALGLYPEPLLRWVNAC